MRLWRSAFAFAIGTAFVTGCGGGNSSPTTHTTSSTISGSAVLTITLPKNIQYATRKGTTSAQARHGQFVDPATTAVMDITVNSVAVPGNPLPLSSFVASNNNSTFTTPIPAYSGYNTIVVNEYTDSTETLQLATGSSYENYASPGTAGTFALTMDMVVAGIASTTNPNGTGGVVLGTGTPPANFTICAAVGASPLTYLYAVDGLFGYVNTPYPFPGVPNVIVESQSSAGTGTSAVTTNRLGGVTITIDSAGDLVNFTLGLDSISAYTISGTAGPADC
jgi:hypothetical protein